MKLPLVRACGSCTACCQALQVRELGKADYVRCKHLRTGPLKGCSVYSSRPDGCREYQCFWIAGLIPNEYKPERCGFVLSSAEMVVSDENGNEENFPFVMVHELREGASYTPDAKAIIGHFAEQTLVCEITREGARKVRGGPRPIVEMMIDLAKENMARGLPHYSFEEGTP